MRSSLAEKVVKLADGFNKWQEVVAVRGFVGFVVTGIYGLRYSLIPEVPFISNVSCLFLPFFLVMRRNCDKRCLLM